jgi:hypothetical protein
MAAWQVMTEVSQGIVPSEAGARAWHAECERELKAAEVEELTSQLVTGATHTEAVQAAALQISEKQAPVEGHVAVAAAALKALQADAEVHAQHLNYQFDAIEGHSVGRGVNCGAAVNGIKLRPRAMLLDTVRTERVPEAGSTVP